jgi:hypothetical protein
MADTLAYSSTSEERCHDSMYRSMDIILYVLYSRDERFVFDMVSRVLNEVAEQYSFDSIRELLKFEDRPVLFRCLFFLMLNFHTPFRFWLLTPHASKSNGLPLLCPHRMCRFFIQLREHLIPDFLVHDNMSMEDFDYQVKAEYIRS